MFATLYTEGTQIPLPLDPSVLLLSLEISIFSLNVHGHLNEPLLEDHALKRIYAHSAAG